jgi:excisionase family DNA binding protein
VDDPTFLLPEVAASRIGIGELQVHELIAAGGLRTVFYRGAVRIALDELNRYLESLSDVSRT